MLGTHDRYGVTLQLCKALVRDQAACRPPNIPILKLDGGTPNGHVVIRQRLPICARFSAIHLPCRRPHFVVELTDDLR
jgi:hypothetical protein